MIVVRRIAGESYDLVTGQEQSKALVLSNGTQELFIPVDDETVMKVVQLMAATPTLPEATAPMFDEDPSPSETNNQRLRVAPSPVSLEEEEHVGEYDDPETGTASI